MPHQWAASGVGTNAGGATVVQTDSSLSDVERRDRIRRGDAFVFSPTGESLALVAWMRVLLEQAFEPQSPMDARTSLDMVRFGAGVGLAAQEMVHHPRTTRMLRGLLSRLQLDLDASYLDIPALHGVHVLAEAPAGGVARPLRPAAYAPDGAVDWLLPIFPLVHPDEVGGDRSVALPPGAAMAYDPTAGHSAVRDVRLRTSFALRLRTVHLDEVVRPEVGGGALRITAQRTAHNRLSVRTLRDYRRAADGAPLPGLVPALTGGFLPGAGFPPVP